MFGGGKFETLLSLLVPLIISGHVFFTVLDAVLGAVLRLFMSNLHCKNIVRAAIAFVLLGMIFCYYGLPDNVLIFKEVASLHQNGEHVCYVVGYQLGKLKFLLDSTVQH